MASRGYYNYPRLPRKLKKRMKRISGIHYQKFINNSFWYYQTLINPRHIQNIINKICESYE